MARLPVGGAHKKNTEQRSPLRTPTQVGIATFTLSTCWHPERPDHASIATDLNPPHESPQPDHAPIATSPVSPNHLSAEVTRACGETRFVVIRAGREGRWRSQPW